MNADPKPSRHQISATVAQYIADYTPALPSQQWLPIASTVRHLVAATVPPTPNDAKVCLGHTARYLVWVLPRAGTFQPHTVMTSDWVERYCRENPQNLGEGTLAKQREVLRRVLRALDGERPCTRRQARSEGAAPYGRGELAALDFVAAPDSALAAVLAAAGTGRLVRTGDFGDLDAARLEAAPTGVALRADRLRATAIADTLRRHPTVYEAITVGGLTRAALTGILAHLPRPNAGAIHLLLRG